MVIDTSSSQDGSSLRKVAVFNNLPRERVVAVRLLVSTANTEIRDKNDKPISAQLLPTYSKSDGVWSSAVFEVIDWFF